MVPLAIACLPIRTSRSARREKVAVDGGWAAGYYHAFLPGAPAGLAAEPGAV